MVAAVGVGNAAYQTGNLTGAALGLQGISEIGLQWWALLVGLLAGALLASGVYALIEKLLIALVALMGLVFLLTLFMVQPSFSAMLGGLLVPSLPQGSLLTIMALIGTTVVPYNLFLHASAVQEKWDAEVSKKQALRESRMDASLSIGLGGLITLAIMSTSAATFFGGDVAFSAASMSQQLEPLLGAGARYLFAAGLFAAGLSSAVTARPGRGVRGLWCPRLAAGLARQALSRCMVDSAAVRHRFLRHRHQAPGRHRVCPGGQWFPAAMCARCFCCLLMNRKDVLGDYVNKPLANTLGVLVVLVTVALGLLKILQATGAL